MANKSGNIAIEFENCVQHHPDKTAIIADDASHTYSELSNISTQLASLLLEKGHTGKNIGISLPRSASIIVSILAVLKAGNAYVFLDPGYPAERLNYILQHSEISLVITIQKLAGNYNRNAVPLLILDKISLAEYPVDNKTIPVINDFSRAYIMYTSGSTGKPKGVEILHENVMSYLGAIKPLYQLHNHDIYLETASFSFSSSVRQYLLPLLNGLTVVLADEACTKSLPLLLALIKDKKITVIDTTQSLWKYGLLQIERFDKDEMNELFQSNLRLMVFSGDMLPARLVQKIRQVYQLPPKIINIYGQTETIGSFAFPIPESFNQSDGIVPIGYPLTHTKVKVVDENMNPVEDKEPGEAYISSPSVAVGYFRDPELTRQIFLDKNIPEGFAYKTIKSGDIIRYNKEGPAEIIGRKDFQIKIRGIRIETNEIENVLLSHPGIKECVVVAFKDPNGENKLAAFVISADDKAIETGTLKKYLKKYLPEVFIPERFLKVERIPVTPNGKTDRRAMQVIAGEDSERQIQPGKVEYKNETEKILYNLFARILNIDNFSKYDSFFDLGGHSLLAVELVEIMSMIFNKNIPIDHIYRFPSVDKLVSSVEQIDNLDDSYNIVAIQPTGKHDPFICVHGDDANFYFPKYLGNDIPFYGYFHQGRNGEAIQYTGIKSIAVRYVDELLKLKPSGPYILGGYSIGGVIAAEMVHLMQKANQDIKLLILIDAKSPNYRGMRIKGTKIFNSPDKTDAGVEVGNRFSVKTFSAKVWNFFEDRLFGMGYYVGKIFVWLGFKVPIGLRNNYIMGVYRRARTGYVPEPIKVKTLLIRSTDDNFEDFDLGWSRFIHNSLDIREIGSDHNTIIKEPRVKELARIIRHAIVEESVQK